MASPTCKATPRLPLVPAGGLCSTTRDGALDLRPARSVQMGLRPLVSDCSCPLATLPIFWAWTSADPRASLGNLGSAFRNGDLAAAGRRGGGCGRVPDPAEPDAGSAAGLAR